MSSVPAIDARAVEKSFDGGRIRALSGMNLDVAEGELVALTGPSAAASRRSCT